MIRKKEQQKIEKIRNYILKTGYPTEIETSNILRRDGWLVGNQWPYTDKETKKVRTVDVLAMKMRMQPPKLGVLLLIECKKSAEHDWAFYTQEKARAFLPFMATFANIIEILSPLLGEELMKLSPEEIMVTKFAGLHLLDRKIKIGVLNVIPAEKKKARDDFYQATNQMISALEGLGESMKSFVVFPTIIFDGDLFEFYQENTETKVNPINHVQFLAFREGMTAFLIDIIRKTYFPEYLEIVRRDFYILTEFIKERSVAK